MGSEGCDGEGKRLDDEAYLPRICLRSGRRRKPVWDGLGSVGAGGNLTARLLMYSMCRLGM